MQTDFHTKTFQMFGYMIGGYDLHRALSETMGLMYELISYDGHDELEVILTQLNITLNNQLELLNESTSAS